MLKLAEKLAESSNGKYKIGCVITDKRGNILSTGVNNYHKTHPLQSKYAEIAKQPERVFLHAEIAAIIRLPYHSKPHTVYIARHSSKGKRLAKPCLICMNALKDINIQKVIYTI